ncbi:MAG TPA: adenylate/guanylate cyclase domain-containing protein [Actinomycetota bacterium]|jgi:class 3 adenylate cyclase|nr:adenylate/guanylate cyclase domain-containing protein [Actinomycetota bacterium]
MAHDLPDSADRRRSSRARRAAIRLRSPRLLVLHAGIYLVVNGFALVVWLLAPDPPAVQGVDPRLQDQFWPGWTLLLLGVPLGLHATIVLATRPSRARAALAALQRPDGPQAPASRPGVDQTDRTLVTVLFTDIVGSTERAREAGDRRWAALLDAHDRLARELVDRFGGRLIKSTGDGVLAAFDRPGRAIRCATALRDRLRGIGVEIRAGLHTGEVQFRGDDVGGIAVHIAARVMATAGPGEVLVSRTVHDLVTGSDYVLEDRGAHPLRGMAGEWQLFAVRA